MANRAKTTEHSKRFDTVNGFYNEEHTWPIERVRKAVACKWITADEFEEITGEKYVAE